MGSGVDGVVPSALPCKPTINCQLEASGDLTAGQHCVDQSDMGANLSYSKYYSVLQRSELQHVQLCDHDGSRPRVHGRGLSWFRAAH